MTNEKTIIIDLANKMKYKVSKEQLAWLAGCGTPLGEAEFVDWHARINELDLSQGPSWANGELVAQLRAFLHRVLDMTRMVGGRAVRVGKRIVRWIFAQLSHYPTTLFAAVAMAALCFAIGNIPFLGPVLLPVAKTAAAGMTFLVFLGECVRSLGVSFRCNG